MSYCRSKLVFKNISHFQVHVPYLMIHNYYTSLSKFNDKYAALLQLHEVINHRHINLTIDKYLRLFSNRSQYAENYYLKSIQLGLYISLKHKSDHLFQRQVYYFWNVPPIFWKIFRKRQVHTKGFGFSIFESGNILAGT